MTDEQPVVVRVDNVVKDVRPGFGLFAKRILHGVSFEVKRGEIFGFVGPNGAGKTTTLKVLMGLISATEGRATILGKPVSEAAARRHIGFLPENPYFYDHLTGREILRFYAKLSGVARADIEARVEELLDWVNLTASADGRLRTYSKGMLQRVGIAQALVHDPDVVFLDEPMSGLAPIGRKEVRDLILRLRDEGKTIFMNSHILSDVEMVCDRVAIIVGGRIRFTGRVEEFFGDGANEAEVILSGISADFASLLEERYRQELGGASDRLSLKLPEKEVPELLATALAADVRVLAVTPQRASLESIFLSAVEDANKAGTASPAKRRRAKKGGRS